MMFLILFAMLGLFGYYTYTGTVVHVQNDKVVHAALMPYLRVDESMSGGTRLVTAYLSLQNSSPDRLRLVDTRALSPLYEIQMRVKAENSEAVEMVPMTADQMAARRSAAGNPVFNSDDDALLELIPGSALTRAINLSSLFDLRRNGKYELSITYQPESVIKGTKDMLASSAHAQKVACSISFDLPIAKPDVKPEAAPPKNPAPAAKNP